MRCDYFARSLATSDRWKCSAIFVPTRPRGNSLDMRVAPGCVLYNASVVYQEGLKCTGKIASMTRTFGRIPGAGHDL